MTGDDIDGELGQLLDNKTYDRAATLAMTAYGPELYGFLVHLMGNETAAADVFSQMVEDLWRGLPAFEQRCSLRTWMYLLARHAGARFRRSPWNRGGRCADSILDELVATARSRTAPWLQTDVKDRWRALRDELEPDDKTLLVLRVDRDLAWSDVARVMLGDDGASDDDIERESARLRKRFQLLKTDLRERARKAGLVDG
jgi:RNA polymerase sigma-70 factor (ECF subfamily)